MRTDSPDLVIAMRLLDHLKLCGFQFLRGAPGEDGPLPGNRVSGDWVDAIHLKGFSLGTGAQNRQQQWRSLRMRR